MLYQNRNFTRMLNVMRSKAGFQPSFLAVFLVIAEWTNGATGQTYPAQAVIARECSKGRKRPMVRETVNRAVRWLAGNGFIGYRQRRRRLRDLGVRFLSCCYWIAKDIEHVDWLYAKRQADALARYLKARARAPTFPAAPTPYKAETQRSRDAREAYWLAQFSCDGEVTAPSRTEFNPDTLMSPDVKKPPDGG